MRELNKTELFQRHVKDRELGKIVSAKADSGIGEIVPQHIETELLVLKNTSKNSYMPYLTDAVNMYENLNGRIRLFNLGNSSEGRTHLPIYLPFLSWRFRNRVNDGQGAGLAGMTPAIMMNMFRIGHWNEDGTRYLGLSTKTDLYSTLETGVIMYKLLVEGKSKQVFSNEVVLKHLTKIYTSLFSNALISTAGTRYGIGDFQEDAARFLIAKFFLLYVLQKPETELVDDIAYYAVNHFSTLASLKSYEETSSINYTSLSKFLSSFGELFFNKEISLAAFVGKWDSMYGEAMTLAIEYVPYLLHFLFAASHGAVLGGSLKLYLRAKDLRNDGLTKLYNAVIAELR